MQQALRPKARPETPAAPILGDASLIRYRTDAMMSVVLFATGSQPFEHEQNVRDRRFVETTSS